MSPPRSLRQIPLMPLAGLAITLVAGLAALALSVAIARANRWVVHSVQTQVSIAQVGERMATYESALRGYLVGANPQILPEMAAGRRALLTGVTELEVQTADNPAQQATLAVLKRLVDRRITGIEATARDRLVPALWEKRLRYSRPAVQKLRTGIQDCLQRMFAEEQRLLEQRQRRTQWLIAGLGSGLALAVLLVVLIGFSTVRDARVRYAALEQAHGETRAQMAAREAAESQIVQMQKMETIGQLTGGIAHDFNNMLAVIIGSLDMARRYADRDPGRVASCIDAARDGADRAAELVARLLAFARRQPLSPAPVDINALVTGMSELLRRTLGERVRIETHLAGGRPCGFADRGQVENAILNLAVNGRDAMEGRSGTITIVTDIVAFGVAEGEIAPGRYVVVAVADTGAGMTPETLSRAIEPFFTTKEVGRGTGLGLSQVFGFAKQSGGHVTIESRVGQGTVVRLFLPRYEGAIAETAAPAAMDETRRNGAGKRVLLVEDEPLVRAFSAEALADLGYDVTVAPDGASALRIIESEAPIALLFTDVIMPGMGGEELAARARVIRPDLKLLYTSGYRGGEGSAPFEGGAALLSKPFTVAQLAAHVREAIDG